MRPSFFIFDRSDGKSADEHSEGSARNAFPVSVFTPLFGHMLPLDLCRTTIAEKNEKKEYVISKSAGLFFCAAPANEL